MAQQRQLTIKQAASALGVSPRTIRRRIAAGELSAGKVQRGKQMVTVVDAAQVAILGQADGTPMSPVTAAPPAEPAQPVPTVAELVATCDGKDRTLEAQAMTIAALSAEVEFLREQVRLLLTRALPPGPVETPAPIARQGLWQRLTQRGNR